MTTHKPLCFGIPAYVSTTSAKCVKCDLARDCATRAVAQVTPGRSAAADLFISEMTALVEERALLKRPISSMEGQTAGTLPDAIAAGYLTLCKLGVPERIGTLMAEGVNPIPEKGFTALRATVEHMLTGAGTTLAHHLQQTLGWKAATAHVAASRSRALLSALDPRLSNFVASQSVSRDIAKL